MKKSICVLLIFLVALTAVFTGCGKDGNEDTYIQNTTGEQAGRIAESAYSEATEPNTENITTAYSSSDSAVADITETATVARTWSQITQTIASTISVTTKGKKKSGFFKKKTTTELTTTSIPTETEVHGEEFFNDAVFIGDSVTLGLSYYVNNQRDAGKSCLGKAQFLCSGSMSYSNSRGDVGKKNTIHPTYKGQEVLIEDGIKLCGAKKAFIMLGMNDFAAYDIEYIKGNIRDTLDKIIAKNPGIKIYIESVTPIAAGKEHGKFNNQKVDEFNEVLKGICREYSLQYVDINSQFKDANGCFNASYCGDNGSSGMGIHMNPVGCKAWVDYLIKTF